MSAESKVSRGVSDVEVRWLVPSDIPTVSTILSKSPDAAKWSHDSLCQLVLKGFCAWVAEQAGGVTGFLIGRIAGEEFEILNLAVKPDFRRRGIASKLLECALNFSRRGGAQRTYLEVRASNESAIDLYTRYGFVQYGRRIRYYRNPVEDALLFCRRIDMTP